MSEAITQQEAAFVTELPPMPAPTFDVYLVVAFYVGPGWSTKTWKIFDKEFTTEAAARGFAGNLGAHYQRRTIYRLHNP